MSDQVTATVPPVPVVNATERVMRGCMALASRHLLPDPAEPPTISEGGTVAIGSHFVDAAACAAAAASCAA